MVRNRASNDEDFVPPTQYPKLPRQIKKKRPPEPKPAPPFDPLPILNKNTYGTPDLPSHIDPSDPYQIFKLFWTDELLDQLVEYTNRNAELNPTSKEKKQKNCPRPWKPTCRLELHAYLAVLIHMGLHIEPTIEDYWHKDFSHGTMHIVGQYISCDRWQQIDRYFYCTKPREQDDEAFQNTFERIWDLSEYLRLRCRKFYRPGIDLAVDETIERFTGRAFEIVNIPTKPTPEGFKIWVLGNQGYVLDWMFHSKGNKGGPYDLDLSWCEEEGFSKTQAVVLDFLTQRDNTTGELLYPPNMHVVWLDNLFTSVHLLQRLRKLGIGAAGTVRTTRTKREEQEDLSEEKEVKNEKISSSLVDLKLIYNSQIPWGTLYAETSEDSTVIEFAWKDAQVVLFMSTVADGELVRF